jgi:hypothetical protein
VCKRKGARRATPEVKRGWRLAKLLTSVRLLPLRLFLSRRELLRVGQPTSADSMKWLPFPKKGASAATQAPTGVHHPDCTSRNRHSTGMDRAERMISGARRSVCSLLCPPRMARRAIILSLLALLSWRQPCRAQSFTPHGDPGLASSSDRPAIRRDWASLYSGRVACSRAWQQSFPDDRAL